MLNLKNNNKNLGFSFMYLVSVDPMEETQITNTQINVSLEFQSAEVKKLRVFSCGQDQSENYF